ncbi:MAG: ABC transporter substrate-binding protein [Akkermansia sp.]
MNICKLLTRLLPVFSALVLPSCGGDDPDKGHEIVLRFGHFPNITHAQGLIAHHLSREGRGPIEEHVRKFAGKPVRIEWYTFNAGPSAMEALLAGSVHFTYVGPSPAINAFAKTQGADVRLLSGAATGGAALVVPGDSPLQKPADFRGKTILTPQLGNTQDIACRAWLSEAGLKVSQTGGEVTILPTPNPEQGELLRKGAAAGVWTVEPWVSRLLRQQGARIVVRDDSLSTVLATSQAIRHRRPGITRAVTEAHAELTAWIAEHPQEAQAIVCQELEELTHSRIDPELVAAAWPSISFTTSLPAVWLENYVSRAQQAGFLKAGVDISGIDATEQPD